MKIVFAVIVLLLMSSVIVGQKANQLLNGKNLKNWVVVLKEPSLTNQVFYVADGVLSASGTTNGYLRTKRSYTNYELTVEWRWVDNPSNSGVLIHINGMDKVWPHCIEAQLKHGNAGDIVLMQVGAKATVNNNDFVIKDGDRWAAVIPKNNPSSEKLPGEWNKYRIVSYNGKLEFYVNNVLQNSAAGFAPTKGYIGLQSEGSHIQFKNIYLKKLK